MRPSFASSARFGLVCALGAVVGLSSNALGAVADDCEDICGAGSGACVITASWDVDPEAEEIDCSGRDLTINLGGWLKVTDGSFVLRARNLTIDGSASVAGGLMAIEGPDESMGGITVELSDPNDPTPPTPEGNLILKGAIRANGDHGGGTISITASGNVTLQNYGTDGIEADGTGNGAAGPDSASGGEVRIEAGGAISLQDPIHVEGAGSGINAGGTIELIAGGDITTSDDGHLSAQGRDLGGGTIRLVSTGGNIILNEHVVVDGKSAAAAGGEIEIDAAAQIQLNEYLWARGSVSVGSGDAAGGQVSLHAGCGGISMAATGDIDVTGGEVAGGRDSGGVVIEAMGPISMASGTLIDTHGKSNGADAGQVRVRSHRTLTADGATINAAGNSSGGGHGAGGAVELSACTADIKGTTLIDVRGYSGGTVAIYGQHNQAAGGIQPVKVASTVQIKGAGTDPARNGATTLRADSLAKGVCSNSGAACWINTDCTAGCETGTCNAANPDTQGVATQFDLAIARSEIPGLGASCATVCQ